MKTETICLHGGQQPDPSTNACAVPVYRTSSFVFDSTEHAANLFALKELGNIYTRLMNPTTDVLEKRVCLLEGAHEMAGLGFASGTAAIFNSIINLAESGDNIVSARNLYGGSYTMFNDILPKMGIDVSLVDSTDPAHFEAAINDKTRALFCETVSNPALEVADLEAIAAIAHAHGLPLIVDATFSTPYLTRPLDHGADIVIHSLTKWFGGHGVGLGGIVVDSGKFNWAGGKHPLFDEPDNSYHGLRWGHDLPEPLAPLAFILRMRTVPLRNLGACISPDIPKHIYGDGQNPKTHPRNTENVVGSGPFKLVEYKSGEHVILERFDNFFIDGRPYLDKIVMRIITDPAARAIAYENGEIHMGAFESLPRIINRLKKVDNLTVTDEGYGGIGPLDWLAMNTTKGPLKDVRVRKAIAYAVDKNFIHKALMEGTASNSLTGIHPDSPFYNTNVEGYDVDLDKARALLD